MINMIGRIVLGLVITAFAAKGAARLGALVATDVFGSVDTIILQWVLAAAVGILGLIATLQKVHVIRP